MAHTLITLLEGDTLESLALQELRAMTRDGVDVELIADILSRAHRAMRQLGLDPSDTTAEELYTALLGAVQSEQWMSVLDEADYVLLEVDGQVISFNPLDVIDNYHHGLPLDQQRTSAAKRGLGWEITRRYDAHPQTHRKHVLRAAEKAKWPTEEPQFCRVVFGKPSILAIGDIASEAMLTLSGRGVELAGGGNNRKIMIDIGAKIAAQHTVIHDATGGAANAAIAFAQLGIQPSLMSWLGDDTTGQQSLTYLRRHGVDMSGVVIAPRKRTNFHYILRQGIERTLIAQYEAFDYRWRVPACKPDWVYLSMISQDSWELHESLLAYLHEHEEVKLAFQPGAAHLAWGAEKLAELYARSEVVILNVDEAMAVTGKAVRTMEPLLRALHGLGPSIVVVTQGAKGASAFDGETIWSAPAYPDPDKPVDRTGAGDAFAATLVAGLAHALPLEEALRQAPVNSMSVVQELGAQAGLLDQTALREYLDNAPHEYRVTRQ